MSEYLNQLSESQRQAVEYIDGASLVVAGAGSGKTRVLTYKIAYLLEHGIAPYSILALTFTNKAAREMKSRIAQIVGESEVRRLWMGTFHSIFSRILRRESETIGYSSDFTIYDAQDSKNLIKTIIKEKALDEKLYKPAQIQAQISKVKNALITPELYVQDRELIEYDQLMNRPRTAEIYANYWERCKTAGVMDFDDLLLYTYILFNKHQDIVERYRNMFRFILVDEYQDTNHVQHEIVRQLAAEHQRVCVVGDDAQSIYSFRGANIGNILNFQKIFPETRLFKLEQNYRSTQTIVNAANSLIKKNLKQIPKTIYSKKSVGEKIPIITAYSDFEEGYIVASRIAEMRMLNNYAYSDFAILYRTNAQSRIFEESLRKINIPYRIYGGLSFYQRKEIKDIVSYMRLITNPKDEEALKRIINYPTRGIGDTTVAKIAAAANLHHVSLWQVASNPIAYNLNINSGTAKKLAAFCGMIQSLIDTAHTQDAYELGIAIIKETDFKTELYEDKTPEGLSRVQNIEELLNSLQAFVLARREEGDPNILLGDFLAEISLMTDADTDDAENANRVTMMTIHSAKGLEFKNVFVVGMEEDLFPSEYMSMHPAEIEEERRLFYVAITRAEENAILTYSKSRFRNGQTQTCRPSRFLADIDESFLKGAKPKTERYGEPVAPHTFKILSAPNVSPAKAVSTSSETSSGLSVGDRVRHHRFGVGEVLSLSGADENAKAEVMFDHFGVKNMLLHYAKLEPITP